MEPRTGRLTEAEELGPSLRASVDRQESLIRSSLVLNPVENFPFADDLAVAAGPLHGLYNSDRSRGREERVATDHQFAGRGAIERDCRKAYSAWAKALGAEDATLRLLSGLHAHAVLFMSIARPGDRVLLLPIDAGGHLSGRQILERLGLEVVDMVVDADQMCVDLDRTITQCEARPPQFVFVDRSEGLVVEDFSALAARDCVSVFDASQYLTNILAGDHPNPFASGFDLLVSSIHKNFPGPQKALLAARESGDLWRELLRGVSTYVSNMDLTSIYAATLTLARASWLTTYSKRMLACSVLLEQELIERGVPAVRRPSDKVPTHHVWIRESSRERAFDTFEALEQCRFLANYRKLPYSLGYGIRMGLSAAVRVGLTESDVPRLAELIAGIRQCGPTSALREAAKAFSEEVWEREGEVA